MKTKPCKFCQSEIPVKATVCPICKRTLKKKHTALGIICTILGIFIFVGVISAMSSGSDSNSEPASSTQEVSADDTANENETKNEEWISADEYGQIENGMSYEQVKEIVGSEGEEVSTVTVGDMTTTIYMWYGKDHISNANVTFQNDAVMAKAQIGLK